MNIEFESLYPEGLSESIGVRIAKYQVERIILYYRFEYHIGGFKEPDNVIKQVTLLFPFAQNVDLQPGKTTELTIAADVYDWFYNPHDIRFNVVPFIHSPGPLAKQVSENYSKMFTVVDIVNEP